MAGGRLPLASSDCSKRGVRATLPRLTALQSCLRYIDVRTYADARRRVIGAHVGEQKQHQQSSSLAAYVCAPFHKVRMVIAETHIDVPAIVTGCIPGREADWESTEAFTRLPAACPNELVECRVQPRRIRRLPKRRLAKLVQANYRPGPRRTIFRIAAGGLPQDRAPLLCALSAKGAIDADNTVTHERGDVICAERRI